LAVFYPRCIIVSRRVWPVPCQFLQFTLTPAVVYRLTNRRAHAWATLRSKMPVNNNNSHPMRRSTRIEREIRLLITSLDPERRVCEECHTVAFNANGCGVRAQQRIRPGTRVLLDLLTHERSAKGVVIDAVPLDSSEDDWLIGIELETSGNFWGLSEAPLDWLTGTERRSTAKTLQRGQHGSAATTAPTSVCSVFVSDISPFACYVKSSTTLILDSVLEIYFQTEKLRVCCRAIVRLEHPNAGMGLEFIPSDSDSEKALHLLIQLLIASGQAADVKSTIHSSQKAGDKLLRPLPRSDSASEDPLLLLILKADSSDATGFLEKLRQQRLRQ
jgi:hypothetical protein